MSKNHLRAKEPLDIEQNILTCWSIVDEIRLLNEAVQDKEIDTDSIANILLGLEYLYELKFQKLMEAYSNSFKTEK